jgi:histidine decarboxylase
MRKPIMFLVAILIATYSFAQSSGFSKLDEWTKVWREGQQTYFGYPVNQESPLHAFYEWYLSAGMDVINLNNAGDPMTETPWRMSSHAFDERENRPFYIRSAQNALAFTGCECRR